MSACPLLPGLQLCPLPSCNADSGGKLHDIEKFGNASLSEELEKGSEVELKWIRVASDRGQWDEIIRSQDFSLQVRKNRNQTVPILPPIAEYVMISNIKKLVSKLLLHLDYTYSGSGP